MGPPGRKPVASRGANRGSMMKKMPRQLPTREPTHDVLTLELQQNILDVFARAFSTQAQNPELKSVIQKVKGHLYNRDFAAAFGNLAHLEAYAVRWSAARALAYADILARNDRIAWFASQTSSGEELSSLLRSTNQDSLQEDTSSISAENRTAVATAANSVRIACIGGGAGAEIVALAATLVRKVPCHILAIDVADWNLPIQYLQNALTTPPSLSPHASQAVRDSNVPFVDTSRFSVTFLHKNILDPSSFPPQLSLSTTGNIENDTDTDVHDRGTGTTGVNHVSDSGNKSDMFSDINIVTIMFTLNELFAVSLPKTTALLLRLTDALKSGSHLVVVDSPGSYSEIKLGKSEEVRKYPMKWLLDHTLLEVAGTDRWEKIEDQDSVWFRLDDRGRGLKYPVELENCRYQIHVYRKQ